MEIAVWKIMPFWRETDGILMFVLFNIILHHIDNITIFILHHIVRITIFISSLILIIVSKVQGY